MKVICNKKEFEINEGVRIRDVLKDEIEKSGNKIITCICNNKVRSLNHRITEDSNIKLIDFHLFKWKKRNRKI